MAWYTEPAATNTYDFSQVITANIDLYAKWNIQQFTITYHDNKPSAAPADATLAGLPDPVNINYNQPATLPTPPTLTGYNFVAWYTEEAATNQFNFSQSITTSINLYAKWSQDPVVTFDTQRGSNIESQTLTGTTKRATRPDVDPTREDYTFDNWYTTAETGTTQFNFDQDITAQSTTVYARWNRIIRTVTYNGNRPDTVPEETTVSNIPAIANVNSGDMVALPTTPPVLQDYDFQGWFVGTITGTMLRLENTAFAFETTVIKADLLLYAKWTRTHITVTFHGRKPSTAPEGATITGLTTDPTIVTVNSGETTTAPIPAPELTGYTLDGWFIGTISGGTLTLQDTAFDFALPVRGENINLYTKWLQQFTVTYHGNKPGDAPEEATVTGVLENPVSIPEGQTATVPTAPELTGYNFVAWYTEATATNQFDFSQGITTSIDLYAKWTQDPVVTFDTRGGSAIEPQRLTETPKRATRPDNDPIREDYTFDNWYTTAETGTTQFNFDQDITAQSTTVYARWNRIMLTVTYHGNKPDAVPEGVSVSDLPDPATVNVDSGDTATEPATPPVLQDYVFQGWFAGTTTGTTPMIANTAFVFETTVIKENKDLYAKWTRKEITITFYGNKPSTAPEGATITGLPNPKTVTVNSGETTTALKPAPGLTGYTLDGWFIGTTSEGTLALQDTAFDFTQPVRSDNINLYAKWTKDPVVTFDTQGGNNIMSQTITRPTTRATRPDEPARVGYAFDNWYTMATGGTLFDFTKTITSSITVYARWIQQFTVTYHANKPSDAPQDATVTGVSTTPVTVNSGDSTSAPNDPTLTGYNFVGWYTEEAATNQFNFSQVITTSIDLYAKWTALQTFTVTYHANWPNGRLFITNLPDPATINVNSGDTATEPTPAPELQDYDFQGWFAGTTTIGTTEVVFENTAFDFTSTAIEADLNLYAKWTRTQITITYHGRKPSTAPTDASITGLTTDPTIVTVNSGDRTTAPAPLLTGYALEGWYKDTASTTGTVTLENTAFDFAQPVRGENINLYTKWLQQFTVTYHGNKPGDAPEEATITGVTENPVSLFEGQTATAPTPPTLADYNFVAWYTQATTTNLFDFSQGITANIDLYAKWSQNPVVTFDTQGGSALEPQTLTGTQKRATRPDMNPSRTPYTFKGWFTTATGTNEFIFDQDITAPRTTVYAQWLFKPKTKAALIAEINSAITTTIPSPNLNYIDTSLITDMSELFKDKKKFNGNISSWNVSKVTNMFGMFNGAFVFNGDLSSWNVSLVENMSSMFINSDFNQNISSWNVSKVTDMSSMFFGTTVFNQNISSWNVSTVTNMRGMFGYTAAFNQNISSWNVSTVTNMRGMFEGNTVFNQNLSSWNVAKVTNMSSMFDSASAFNQNISNWNVDAVTNFNRFRNGSGLSNENIPPRFRSN